MMAPTIIGLGTADRGDDAAGLEVARRLAHRGAIVYAGDPLGAIDVWRGHHDVVLVDAMRTGATPGTTVTYDVTSAPLPSATFVTSHAMGLAEAVELARVMGTLPDRVVVIGIEAASFEPGSSLSAQVLAAVERLVGVFARA